jgi:hypothetical protein
MNLTLNQFILELCGKSSQKEKFLQSQDKLEFSSKRGKKGVLMNLKDNLKQDLMCQTHNKKKASPYLQSSPKVFKCPPYLQWARQITVNEL